MIHILPVGDLREHVESTICWCQPTVLFDAEMIVVHNSADGREVVEQAAQIINGDRK